MNQQPRRLPVAGARQPRRVFPDPRDRSRANAGRHRGLAGNRTRDSESDAQGVAAVAKPTGLFSEVADLDDGGILRRREIRTREQGTRIDRRSGHRCQGRLLAGSTTGRRNFAAACRSTLGRSDFWTGCRRTGLRRLGRVLVCPGPGIDLGLARVGGASGPDDDRATEERCQSRRTESATRRTREGRDRPQQGVPEPHRRAHRSLWVLIAPTPARAACRQPDVAIRKLGMRTSGREIGRVSRR